MSTRAIHSYAYLFTFGEIRSGEILRKNTVFHDERSSIQHETAQCGEGGIRTLEWILSITRLAGGRLKPLGHLSKKSFI